MLCRQLTRCIVRRVRESTRKVAGQNGGKPVTCGAKNELVKDDHLIYLQDIYKADYIYNMYRVLR